MMTIISVQHATLPTALTLKILELAKNVLINIVPNAIQTIMTAKLVFKTL